MPKWSGDIGYALAVETQPGVWTDSITVKKYYGDVVTDNRKFESGNAVYSSGNQMNENLSISNKISVVSNSFMLENLSFMKYITFMKSKWRISSVDIQPPRIIITIGGMYYE